MTRPNPHIALIYHYDLARALDGEPVDWQAIPVNVDAGREGGDLCRAAADFAKRRDLFAMPAPDVSGNRTTAPACEPADLIEGPKVEGARGVAHPDTSAANRDRLRARIADLIATHWTIETLLRQHWPADVPPLSKPGHTDDQLAQILAAVRRVETEVGAAWHPDDGPPPHVNTNPRAEIEYPVEFDEGGGVPVLLVEAQAKAFNALNKAGKELCRQIASEAHAAGRSISVAANPTVRRWTIARAVIAWAASGRSVDDLWFTASMLATFEQTRDPAATLGGLISQFTISQAERLYEAASNPTE